MAGVTLNIHGKTTPRDISDFFAKALHYVFKRKDTINLTIAQEVFEELVKVTPVKTGFARANWSVGVNSAPDRNLVYGPHYDPPEYNGPTMTTIRDQWTIANYANYIDKLDQGTSSQAPANFIGNAVNTGILNAIAIMRTTMEVRSSRSGYSPKYKR